MLAGENIIDRVNGRNFLQNFIEALNETSYKQDFVDFSRFGWMTPGYDLVLLSATGFPVAGRDRNPDYTVDKPAHPSTDSASSGSAREEQLQLILIGVALGGLAIIVFMSFLYCRLRRQYTDLEKDRGIPGNLKAMWQRYTLIQGHYYYV